MYIYIFSKENITWLLSCHVACRSCSKQKIDARGDPVCLREEALPSGWWGGCLQLFSSTINNPDVKIKKLMVMEINAWIFCVLTSRGLSKLCLWGKEWVPLLQEDSVRDGPPSFRHSGTGVLSLSIQRLNGRVSFQAWRASKVCKLLCTGWSQRLSRLETKAKLEFRRIKTDLG